MIKRYTQFIKEEIEESVPVVTEGEVDDDPMICVKITQDEENLFNTEPVLQSLVSQRKITYQHGEMCYPKDDQKVIDICKSFFSSVGINESKRLNETRHNEFDEEDDNFGEQTHHQSYHIRRDTQLAQDAFEAGIAYEKSTCDGTYNQNVPDFETWWSNYKK